MCVLSISCTKNSSEINKGVNFRLHEDLSSDSREDLYRSISFIESVEGITLPNDAISRNLKQWKSISKEALIWYSDKTHADRMLLDAEYSEFCKKWAPYFRD